MEPTLEGIKLVKAWQAAEEYLARNKQEVVRAECDLSNAVTALGRWMCPGDVKPGEKFCVWYGDSLIQVELLTPDAPGVAASTYKISVRARGRRGVR